MAFGPVPENQSTPDWVLDLNEAAYRLAYLRAHGFMSTVAEGGGVVMSTDGAVFMCCAGGKVGEIVRREFMENRLGVSVALHFKLLRRAKIAEIRQYTTKTLARGAWWLVHGD
jgi:hypothetical protein